MSICTAQRTNGASCTAPARPGRAFCFAHDPELAERRRVGQTSGGRGKSTAQRLERLTPPTLRPALDALLGALQGVQDGTISPRGAEAIAAVSRALVDVYEVSAVLAGLEDLEDRAQQLDQRYR